MLYNILFSKSREFASFIAVRVAEGAMGAGISTQKISEEDRLKRQNLHNELGKMQHSLRVTAAAHYLSSEHYKSLDTKLQFASVILGSFGTAASVASKLAWKMMVSNSPRLAPIVVATSTTSVLFTAVVNIPNVQNAPANLFKAHFKSGIQCQYLEKRAKFLSEMEVWDTKISWQTLASKYDALLKEKTEVNSQMQSEYWAYRKALKKNEEKQLEKKRKEAFYQQPEGTQPLHHVSAE